MDTSEFSLPLPREALLFAADLLAPVIPAESSRYWHDPAGWIRDHVRWKAGEELTLYQAEIAAALPVRKRVSARGPHGLGKTGLTALLVLWFALTRDAAGVDWKAPTTASKWRQLEKFLWPEIHKWARRLDWERIGRPPFRPKDELLDLSLKLRTGEAFALASDTPDGIEGVHADHVLYVLDEAKAIPPGVFDAVEGAFSGAGGDTDMEAYALAMSTPGEPNGRFYEIQSRKPGTEDWWPRHVTLEEAIAAGRISAEWAEQRAKQWGWRSAVYQNRVRGEFATADEDGVIPLQWIEDANHRWEELQASDHGRLMAVGVDVGAGGDLSVIAPRYGAYVAELIELNLEDPMEVTGHVSGVLHGATRADEAPYAAVDVIGIGAGVVGRLRELGHDVFAFNAAEKSEQIDMSGELGFVNMRSAAWWTMRELLDPANGFDIALPPNDRLTGDLTAPHWRVVSGGRIQVESKADIRKRLGRSTDHGDAVVMAFALRNDEDETVGLIYEDRVDISPF